MHKNINLLPSKVLEQSIFPDGFFKVLTGGTFVPVDPIVCLSSGGKFDTFASGDYAKMGPLLVCFANYVYVSDDTS